MKEVHVHWIPTQCSNTNRVDIFCYTIRDTEDFFARLVTDSKSWLHYHTLDNKTWSVQGKDPGSSHSKIILKWSFCGQTSGHHFLGLTGNIAKELALHWSNNQQRQVL